MKLEPEIIERAKRVKIVLMDCDGVLTDGRITLLPDGDEQKTFHVRDGQGIDLCHKGGLKTGIISGRTSSATERRARELGMTYVKQNARDKVAALNEIVSDARVKETECAFIGDDLGDIPIMQSVGLAIAVGDAADEVKQIAHHCTSRSGGHGAVREAIDLILSVQHRA